MLNNSRCKQVAGPTLLSGDINIPEINCLQQSDTGKTVKVYFDYTSEGLVIPDICPGYNYKLMQHFTDLSMHIHKLKRTVNLTHDLPLDGNYYLKPIGKDLQRAIEGATTYKRENQGWFTQKYGYLRSFSNASDESGYDSGLPQEPVFLDPVTAQLQSYLDATSQDAIIVTPSMIADQDWPAFLAHNPCHNLPDDQHKHIQPRPIHDMEMLPPTANSGEQFEFIPPDDISDFETMSKTLSDQMMSINARNIGDSKKEYDWQQDLALLRVQNGEIPFIDS